MIRKLATIFLAVFASQASAENLAFAVLNSHEAPSQSIAPLDKQLYEQLALMCTGAGEELSGGTKVCFYSCAGRTKALEISVGSLCPLTIEG